MSIQLFVLDKLVRYQMKRRFQRRPDVMLLRPMMAAMARRPSRVPSHVLVSSIALAGVTTERLATASADEKRAVLYIHGGAFIAGSPLTHRALTWRLADALRVPVYAVDYRLAPEHPFPAGLDDVVAAYEALLERGVLPSGLSVGGDSAGGNLAFALMHRLKARGLPMPAALFALSPQTDFVAHRESHETNCESDAMFDPRLFDKVAPLYCPAGDLAHPFVSPMCGDHTGFPRTLIQCSQIEMLRDDGIAMGEKLRAAGVAAQVDVWPGVYHVWQLSADLLPEARDAIAKIVTFVQASPVRA
jgi:monoterpene epsilon-lactone hydrolase